MKYAKLRALADRGAQERGAVNPLPLPGLRVLVTGAAGFIGMHVAERLCAEGAVVTGVDNFDPYYDVELKKARVARLQRLPEFRFERLDLADARATAQLFEAGRFRGVVHLAAQPGVRYSLVNPEAYVTNNLTAFGHVLEGCRHGQVAHLVYASSSSVYGANHVLPFSEDQNVDHPVSLYAATKKANELMAHSYSHLFGLPTTGLRFFTVYGPWGRPDMSPMLFAKAILAGAPITVFNYGKMRRDFTYVDDVVEGVIRIVARPPSARGGRAARDLQHRQSHGGRARDLHRHARRAPRPRGDQGLCADAGRRRSRHLRGDRPHRGGNRIRAAHATRRRARPLRGLVSQLLRSAAAKFRIDRWTGPIEGPDRGRCFRDRRHRRAGRGLAERAPRWPVANHSHSGFTMILVTGGAGFIGANFVLDWFAARDEPLVNLDILTYAGNLGNLAPLREDPRHVFVRGDIGDRELVARLLRQHRPRAIVNFAAESHVDRSIHGPAEFITTNVVGTFNLLDVAKAHWLGLPDAERRAFRFVHVSTDEVYGSLGPDDPAFSETTAYAPNSPYSASKAASDHLVRAYHHTYGLPTLTTNCSNNYGPLQFPEKLIPLMIVNALAGKPLPVYGDGQNVRDWLYVGDHCAALRAVLEGGRPGETYNIGGNAEIRNIDVVNTLCRVLAEFVPGRDFARADHVRQGPPGP